MTNRANTHLARKYLVKTIILFLMVFSSISIYAEENEKAERLIRFKAIYLDMDGTALDYNREVRKATIDVLEKYRRCGGQVGLATGRSPEQVRRYLADLKPNLPLVLYNGAMVTTPDSKTVLSEALLPLGLPEEVLKSGLIKKDVISGVVLHYSKKTFAAPEDDIMREFHSLSMINGITISENYEDLLQSVSEYKEKPIKIMFVLKEGKQAQNIVSEVKARFNEHPIEVIPTSETVEIVAAGVDKSNALEKILKKQGLSKDDIIAFGDSGNDTGMMRMIAVSIAMQDASCNTAREALFVTGSNDSDAIARVIERLVLLEACDEIAHER